MSDAHSLASFKAIRRRWQEVSAFEHALGVLAWDADITMPASGTLSRARAVAELTRLRQRRLRGAAYRRLLAEAENELCAAGFRSDSFERTFVRRAASDEERDRRVPPSLAAAIAEAAELGRTAWRRARVAHNWAVFVPELRRAIDLQRKLAECLDAGDRYGALLDLYEPGLTSQHLSSLISAVETPARSSLAQRRLVGRPVSDEFPIGADHLLTLANELAQNLGIRARIAQADHPNTMRLAAGDIRIAVRMEPTKPYTSLRAAAHECGHALYFQHLPPEFEATPLWGPASAGINEAQARFWEVIVVGSAAFAKAFLPHVERRVDSRRPQTAEELHRGLNGVSGSWNRLDADPPTYLLHIILRTRLEMELIDGGVSAEGVPERWSDLSAALGLGDTGPQEGPLQDIHWSIGLFGYFPTYLVGTLAAYQLWDACKEQLRLKGEDDVLQFAAIQEWLTDQVSRFGRARSGLEIISTATGRSLSANAFVASNVGLAQAADPHPAV